MKIYAWTFLVIMALGTLSSIRDLYRQESTPSSMHTIAIAAIVEIALVVWGAIVLL